MKSNLIKIANEFSTHHQLNKQIPLELKRKAITLLEKYKCKEISKHIGVSKSTIYKWSRIIKGHKVIDSHCDFVELPTEKQEHRINSNDLIKLSIIMPNQTIINVEQIKLEDINKIINIFAARKEK